MIANDQPKIFSDDVIVRVSNVNDGTMTLRSLPDDSDEVWRNREALITSCSGSRDRTALVYVTYDDGNEFCRYREVTNEDFGLATREPCDALVTQEPGVGLFLPIADCCAVTLYDPTTDTLMLSHIGRHSCVQYGARRSVEYLTGIYGVRPQNLLVWLSPAVSANNYPIYARDNRALKDLIVEDLETAGIERANIEISPIETDKNHEYFSHSEYKKGNRGPVDGRFAVFAGVRD